MQSIFIFCEGSSQAWTAQSIRLSPCADQASMSACLDLESPWKSTFGLPKKQKQNKKQNKTHLNQWETLFC